MKYLHKLHRISFLVFFCAVLVFQSCTTPKQETGIAQCPVPQQNCRVEKFSGSPRYDTLRVQNWRKLQLRPVAQLSESSRHEYAVSFMEESAIWMTSEPIAQMASAQEIHRAVLTSPYSASLGDNVSVLFENKILEAGSATSWRSERTASQIFSGISNPAQKFQVDLFERYAPKSSEITIDRLSISDPNAWDSHPALSPDGKFLFFASNRSGGFGGTDIWYSRFLGEKGWSEPKNCGEKINTACDELSPFLALDGVTMMFSSAGHQTLGGYDIFSVAVNLRDDVPQFLTAPQNLGAPINTSFDEIFPTSPERTIDSILYFSSNRRGTFDIFVLYPTDVERPLDTEVSRKTDTIAIRKEQPQVIEKKELEAIFPTDLSNIHQNKDSVPPAPKLAEKPDTNTSAPVAAEVPQPPQKQRIIVPFVKIFGSVVEQSNNEKIAIPWAYIRVKDTRTQSVMNEFRADSLGNFSVNIPKGQAIEISAQADRYFYDVVQLNYSNEDTLERADVILRLPKQLALRINFPLDNFTDPYEFILDDNGAETSQRWHESVDLAAQSILQFSSGLKKIILTGHTDNRSSDAYNMNLGRKRAEFLKAELIKRGVKSALLGVKTRGMRDLLSQRNAEDIEHWQARCRRVEVVKIYK